MTGAASGIGAATARVFADAGRRPRRSAGTRATRTMSSRSCATSRSAAGGASPSRSTWRRRTPSRSSCARLCEAYERIDIVVANAAIAREVPSAELDDERFAQLLDVDLDRRVPLLPGRDPAHDGARGGAACSRRARSRARLQGWSRHAHYAAAKAGIVGLVRRLAVELGPHGITVERDRTGRDRDAAEPRSA